MTTSATQTTNRTRDQIITRALRICNAIGQGETPSSTAVTEAADALNALCQEWNADGMPLWQHVQYSLLPISGTATYSIYTGSADLNSAAPLRVYQAWFHNTSTDVDSPIMLITRQEYNLIGDKTAAGFPNQFLYIPPQEIQALGVPVGTISLYPVPDATFAAGYTVRFVGQKGVDDFSSSGDTLDFPQYWINAVIWGLADQLSYEYGLGLSERAMIGKKAQHHKEIALSSGIEEGSFYIQPDVG